MRTLLGPVDLFEPYSADDTQFERYLVCVCAHHWTHTREDNNQNLSERGLILYRISRYCGERSQSLKVSVEGRSRRHGLRVWVWINMKRKQRSSG